MTFGAFQKLNIFLILFFGASLFVYLLMNGGAFWVNLRYDLLFHSPLLDNDLKQNQIIQVSSAESAHAASAANISADDKQHMTLIIPKIDAKAPIVLASTNDNQGVLSALEEGVGLYPDSALPGEEGRAIILGHSSRASWYRGQYAYVFALLHKLEPLDEFYITTPHQKLYYRVFAHQTLSKDDANKILNSKASGSEVDLMTCYPVGSASKRTIIQAQLMKVENI